MDGTGESPSFYADICRGAGYLRCQKLRTANKTGYQIKVDAVLEGEKTVRIQTSLLGPEKGEKTKDVVTYPYVVVKLKKTEKEILFE